MKRFLKYLPTILAAGLIAYLSLLREPKFCLPEEYLFPHIDKLVHLLMYLFLAAVFALDLYRNLYSFAVISALAFLLPTLYGGIIEILQEQFFYPRTGDWLDWTADLIGATIGVGLTMIIIKIRTNHSTICKKENN